MTGDQRGIVACQKCGDIGPAAMREPLEAGQHLFFFGIR